MKSLLLFLAFAAALVDKRCCYPMEAEISHVPWKWNGKQFPNPQIDVKNCGQTTKSTICDPDDVLTPTEASELTKLTKKIQLTSPCLCKEACETEAHSKGLIIGVAIMKDIYQAYHEDKQNMALKAAKDIRENWKMGSCGNDILILVETNNKLVKFEKGSAVSEILSDELLDDIYNQCVDHFDTGHHYQGLESIINSMYDNIQSHLQKAPAFHGEDQENTKTGGVGLTVGLVIGIACLAGFITAGFLVIRRRQRNSNQDRFMYDGANGRPNSRNMKREAIGPIVKTPMVFPDAIYQPCSVEDTKKDNKPQQKTGSDDEDDNDNNEEQYLKHLEENPAYEFSDAVTLPRALSVVEEGNERSPTEPPAGTHKSNDYHRQSSDKNEKHRDAYA